MTQYHAPQGGLPSQSTLHTGRAVFTNSYAVIPKGCFSDIVTSLIPGWAQTKFWLIARPVSGFSETCGRAMGLLKSMRTHQGSGMASPKKLRFQAASTCKLER